MTDPSPYLQWGALSLLALVLVGIGRFIRWASGRVGDYMKGTVDELRGTMREVRDSLVELKTRDQENRHDIKNLKAVAHELSDEMQAAKEEVLKAVGCKRAHASDGGQRSGQ